MRREDVVSPVVSPCVAALWTIFGRFAGDDRPAYRQSSADLSFAGLHSAVLRFLPVVAGMPGRPQRRPILIWGHKDGRYPVAYWACLLTGHALVPVERETPPERVRQIVETTDACALLVADGDSAAAGRLAALARPGRFAVLEMADPCDGGSAVPDPAIPAPDPTIRCGDAAYIMFSSGTLGRPKGIGISYANLLDFIAWLDILLPVPSSAAAGMGAAGTGAVTGIIRHCFDVSLYELWMSWRHRLPLVVLDHADIANSTDYIARLAAAEASLWVSTPSILRLMLKNRRFSGRTLPSLSTFLFCGEPLTKPAVAILFERFPGCRVINTYGPTECTVAVTSVEISREHLEAPDELPIGAPRPGTWLETAPGTPAGEPGEILIRGASVGLGYIGLPERQARAFPESGLYRSGDLGIVGPGGNWYLRGRMDREIKVQGVRIDLNEIEAHLRRQPGVDDAVVQPYLLHGEARALSAFVLGVESDACLRRLADALAAELPPYLVPRHWYGGFPAALNANSKLDGTQLAATAQHAKFRHIHMHKEEAVSSPASAHSE
ncbi:hypothetical protein TSH100_15230 [Azospirillum sp. TSH100]|uniref:AMP-binding protein n=1 Tax=Azospirillum sp. TSH100 TaxID=652764 RepID=UPI000D60A27F|nr:AMP-binding protein [Azospirillum sp. TSH100]PWC85503.1 hypothetical protein TSH100_15230 [Azospirillum sp. TSH100]